MNAVYGFREIIVLFCKDLPKRTSNIADGMLHRPSLRLSTIDEQPQMRSLRNVRANEFRNVSLSEMRVASTKPDEPPKPTTQINNQTPTVEPTSNPSRLACLAK